MSETGSEHVVRDIVREIEGGLARRIDALERQNRRLRLGARLMFALLVASIAAGGALYYWEVEGTSVAEVVEARRFVVRDDDGSVVAVLGLNPDETVGLSLWDAAAQERLRMILLPDGAPGISFADPRGRSRAVLGLLPDQSASLVFADREGRGRTILGMQADESSTLVFTDSYGYTRAGLGVDRLGLARLTLVDTLRTVVEE
jgi:hypothetical protein